MKDTIELCKAAGFPLMSFEGVIYVSPELERLVALVRADERAAPVQVFDHVTAARQGLRDAQNRSRQLSNLINCGTCGYPLTPEERTSLIERDGVMVKPAPDLQAELDATNRQVEILSDALAESRREIDAIIALARADQREACAALADKLEWADNKGVASAIRARGNT
jgi:hypothetical protein